MRDRNAEYFRPIKKEKEPKESLIKVGSLSDHGKGYGRGGVQCFISALYNIRLRSCFM